MPIVIDGVAIQPSSIFQGSIRIKSTSVTALDVQNAGGSSFFSVDTSTPQLNYTAGTDATSSVFVGTGGPSPSSARNAEIILNSPSSASQLGSSYIWWRRNGVNNFITGIDQATSGAKTTGKDFFFYNGTAYIAAITPTGILNTMAGLTSSGAASIAGLLNLANGTSAPSGGAIAIGIGSNATFGIYFGNTASPAVVAQQGSLYLPTAGASGSRLWVATNSSGSWTPLSGLG